MFSRFKEIVAGSFKKAKTEDRQDCINDDLDEIQNSYREFENRFGDKLGRPLKEFVESYEEFYEAIECKVCDVRFNSLIKTIEQSPERFFEVFDFESVLDFMAGMAKFEEFKVNMVEFTRIITPLHCQHFENTQRIAKNIGRIEQDFRDKELADRCITLEKNEFMEDYDCLNSVKSTLSFMIMDGFKDSRAVFDAFVEGLRLEIKKIEDGSNLERQFDEKVY